MLLFVEESATSITKLGSEYFSYKMRSFFMIDVDNIPCSIFSTCRLLYLSQYSICNFHVFFYSISCFFLILDSAHETKHASCLAESGLFHLHWCFSNSIHFYSNDQILVFFMCTLMSTDFILLLCPHTQQEEFKEKGFVFTYSLKKCTYSLSWQQ